MLCPKCGTTNKEGSNYCHNCGAFLSSTGTAVETETAKIEVAYPQATDPHLRIRVGACRLKVVPGRGASWVTGTYHYPQGALPLKIDKSGGQVTITQDYDVAGLGGLFRSTPRFELALGKTQAYVLTLESGASDQAVDLGGIPLKGLTIKHGAGRAFLDFSAPNPQEMASLLVNSGAVSLQMKGLANANFAEMVFDGGASSLRFDFGGQLRRSSRARISTSLAQVEIHIPSSTAARVIENATAASLNLGDGFTKRGGAFLTEAAVEGRQPELTVQANVSLGSLALRAT